MKGTEKIIAHIRADAQAQCDAILAEAQAQCEAIRADWAQKADEAYGERIRAGVKKCADEADSAARLGRMESKKALLALKQDLIARSFDEAQKRLVSLPLSGREGDFDGGLILRRDNIEVNCTAALLVELCRGEMSAAIADMLFS